MEEIINRILNIEQRAQQIVSNTEAETAEMENKLADKIAVLHQDITARADERIAQISRQEAEFDDDTEKMLKEKTQRVLAGMQKLCDEKKDQWVGAIYRSITES